MQPDQFISHRFILNNAVAYTYSGLKVLYLDTDLIVYDYNYLQLTCIQSI